jgi:hypothetical protein
MVAHTNKRIRKRKTAVWIALFWVFALLAVSVAPIGSAGRRGPPPPTVQLGVDKTWTTANWGSSGTGMSGLGCTRYLGAGYDLYNRRALVNTWAILMGFCTLEAFATVGQTFTVTGTGSMLASVFLYIYAKASLYAFFPILGEAKVDFGPYDDDSGGGSWYNWFLVDF